MVILYTKSGCAYTPVVLRTLEEERIPYEEKNISDPLIADELIAKSGATTTPFIFDLERNIGVGESSVIVEYLMRYYGTPTTSSDEKSSASASEEAK